MRRRPDEDDREQDQRVHMHFARHRNPAEQRWRGAGGATDHDILRRRTLQIQRVRSEEHTSELQSLMRISYAVFCLKKKKIKVDPHTPATTSKRHTPA